MRRAARVGLLAVFLMPLALIGGGEGAEAFPQRLGLPAYWSPATADGRAMFERLGRAGPAAGIVVVNGSRSAPELPYDPHWGHAFTLLHRAGARPIGYVDTGYLGLTFGGPGQVTRPDGPGRGRSDVDSWTAQIDRDIDDWYRVYGAAGLQGIFLDRTTALCGPDDGYVDSYRAVVARIRERHPGAYLVMNPGRTTERCYRDLADTLVTFEGPYRDYLDWRPSGWEGELPAERFWHLVYAAPGPAGLRRAVALSKGRNVGFVHVTDGSHTVDGLGHPWISMPGEDWWRAELLAAAGRAVPWAVDVASPR
ncbi:spherulation-specific family 4 protein [Micromonospora chersina]|uniref:spherulation-specific family 4 protein n=1 Tax=Micromonospora chersina TaxID=47854 RepID=UPI00142F3B92|nr:spherulation-specific family 4 protein [Micromonospora chersina]